MLAEAGFTILGEHVDEYAVARDADRRSRHWRDRIKGYSGLSEFSHAVICSMRNEAAAG
jgi:hypothetical protein